MASHPQNPSVGLFATCLVDLFRPSVGFAAAKLLEAAGCRVALPRAQTCCGQPAYNSGDKADAKRLARRVIATFRHFDFVVVPSGSCAGMIKAHYPEALADDAKWLPRAQAFAAKTYELTAFLHDVMGVKTVPGKLDGIAAYHDSCSSLRENGVRDQPRKLLAGVKGLALRELPGRDVCCGFGGTFCVKYPEISNHMVADKCREIAESGADTVLSGDMGCLMNIAGKLLREGRSIRAYHVAEALAGVETPPIGYLPPEVEDTTA
ncbi:MAG: (Fe-S)-binding protein [Rhodospirillaceae bacterium]|nr:(Fe-S)-binding protein [Rhodospirillaceae bacterium]